ncbi:ASCH domain-containing protein [Paraburkholderia sp. J8-2]|uniref:ASCH domain-containing protein n=1 Tax=Paraburkholderia sp. J8-2 TaxID=2805440 RepID=UPI002AB64E58|nr:ASCH domain-containing protein [Paraburkholderia sp. J8-2]
MSESLTLRAGSLPEPLKVLSIRQPWAWLIVRPDLAAGARALATSNGEFKDIENRSWSTRYRGRVLIHASHTMTRSDYDNATRFLDVGPPARLGITLPGREALERGGVVGIGTLTQCVAPGCRRSPWHVDGMYGFQIANARPLPFIACKGALSFFEPHRHLLDELERLQVLTAPTP